MLKFLRRHKTIVLITVTVVFVGMTLFGIGGSLSQSSPNDVIIKINGEKVRQGQYDRLYNQILRQSPDLPSEARAQLKQQVLQELVRLTVMSQEAKRYGIEVPDRELQAQLRSIPAFQKDGQFDPNIYKHTVYNVMRMSPDDFEKLRKKDLAASKLSQLIVSPIHLTENEVDQALARRIAIEEDPKEKKNLKENPELVKQEIRNQQANWVFADWLNQVNSTLKVNIVSDKFREELAAPPPPPANTQPS